jgi:hypothetical protein
VETDFEILRERIQAMTDTSPAVAAIYRSMIMAKSPEERVLMGMRMFDEAREIMLSTMPPGLSPVDQKRFLFRRTYGEDPPEGLVKIWESKKG